MPSTEGGNDTKQATVLDRLRAAPKQYRLGMARFAHGIREHLPPAIIEHRIEALEKHFDSRLSEIEAKVDAILRRLDKGKAAPKPGDG